MIGFLAVATMFVVVLYKAIGPKPAPSIPGDEDQAAAILGYPPIIAVEALDAAAPTLVDVPTAQAALEGLRTGGVLLVFADPTQAEGRESARVAIDLHRRLRTRDVRVVLVVPKEVVAGNSTDPGRVRRALLDAGVLTDLSVLLDPGAAVRGRVMGREDAPVPAAVLWENGRESWRTAPGGALNLRLMGGAVNRLSDPGRYADRPLPVDATRPPEPTTRFRPGEEERDTGGEVPPPR